MRDMVHIGTLESSSRFGMLKSRKHRNTGAVEV